MRTDRYYQNRLQRYFDRYYSDYEEIAEYGVDPAPNQWQFDIPELKARIVLTCDANGEVTENRTKIWTGEKSN